jgi:hypothetical protein
MKKTFTLILMLISLHAFAQDSLKAFNTARINTTALGMQVLGGWGILNLGTGAIGWGNSTTPEARYFFQMNTIWGGVNFGVALLSYGSLQKDRKKHLTAAESLREQERIEKIFLINGCLDVAYIGTGLYLKIAGDSRNSPIMKGYGESILLQGGFLLIFDGVMYRAEKENGSKLRQFLEKNPITFDGKRVGIILNM